MIINNARGSHSSPGVYTKEVDVTYSVKSLGITSLGVAGETVKGPAFDPIKIEKWSEYLDYFGPTSAEKFKGSGYPKYELPYIAKEYLKESKQLYVCRILGLSGYNAGPAFVIKASAGSKTYPIAILRSTGKFNDFSGSCDTNSGDTWTPDVTSITISKYSGVEYNTNCAGQATAGSDTEDFLKLSDSNLGRFTVEVNGASYPVSLNEGEKDYIYNVFGSGPFSNETPLFVEVFYDYALKALYKNRGDAEVSIVSGATPQNEEFKNYKRSYQCAATPWLVSQVSAQGTAATANRLFRAYTISDGDAANEEVKISIEKIRPNDGTFDLLVRAMNDTDSYPIVLEKFSGCNLIPGDKNYLPLRVGSYDGVYELKSKYIAIEMSENRNLAGAVPCGFEGYPLHKASLLGCSENLPVGYNVDFDYALKAKRQYFGFSNISGIDIDTFRFKGADSDKIEMSNGFHMDSIISQTGYNNEIRLDGETAGTKFTSVGIKTGSAKEEKIPRIVTEDYMKDTLYADINTRKFTVCFYGGFDGWDIYRTSRTNTDNFKATRYFGESYGPIDSGDFDLSYLDLPVNAISSDYYAYLAGYRQFSNPEAIDINVFATPGIDWVNNELLVEDALDVIEDSDDGRGGDALYIPTTPNKPFGSVDTADEMYTPDEIVNMFELSSIDTSYAATYWPWIKYFDKEDNVYINLPVTKDVVRNLAYVDNTSYPWFAPAGINRGDVNCVRACMKTRLADEDTLYDSNINPVKTFAVDGVKIWGNKTMYSVDSPLNRVNVRRLMIRIKKLITGVGKQLIFDQYDNTLKNQFLSLVTPILSNVKANRGIFDYRIDIDDSAEARDAHTLPCTIHIKPTPTLEYIDLTFTIYPESVDFRD